MTTILIVAWPWLAIIIATLAIIGYLERDRQ